MRPIVRAPVAPRPPKPEEELTLTPEEIVRRKLAYEEFLHSQHLEPIGEALQQINGNGLPAAHPAAVVPPSVAAPPPVVAAPPSVPPPPPAAAAPPAAEATASPPAPAPPAVPAPTTDAPGP
jgi:hypothetical protein